jgi:hypothetical protein
MSRGSKTIRILETTVSIRPRAVSIRGATAAVAATLTFITVRPAAAQGGHQHSAHSHSMQSDSTSDSAFAALQARGKKAMGVDQYTSTHRFDDLPDGGRIELTRDATDSAGVRTIREHLAHIARAFAAGDFTTPFAVHAREVPGTKTMAAKRDAIHYVFEPLPGGGEVRISSKDPEAIRAIHAFMAFQRGDHRAGGEHP